MSQRKTINIDQDSIIYRGEGNATFVVAIKNSQKVLCFVKYPKEKDVCENEIKKQLLDHIYFSNTTLKHLINSSMFDEPILVFVNQKDVNMINRLTKNSRPKNRLDKSIVITDTWALLVADYCCMPKCISSCYALTGPVISVEIKPKQGFLPSAQQLDNQLWIKAKVCRFALKQAYKLKIGAIKKESDYCPLDLFSGSKSRMIKAIQNLIQNPQNNFRIFKDLQIVFNEDKLSDLDSALTGFLDENYNIDQKMETILLNLLIKALLMPILDTCNSKIGNIKPSNTNKPQFCLHHSQVEYSQISKDTNCDKSLPKNCILDTILKLQKLDTIDSAQALYMYYLLKKKSPQAAYYLENYWSQVRKDSNLYTNLGVADKVDQETEDDYYIRKLLEYLISLMAKDCSIMITMQRLSKDYITYSHKPLSSSNIITDDITGSQYVANVAITDLDKKGIHKIEEFYKNDLQIIDDFKSIHLI